MNLQPPSRLSPPSPLTFLHFSFLPTLSFLPVYLTSLSSPSILHHLPFFPLFLLSIRPFLSILAALVFISHHPLHLTSMPPCPSPSSYLPSLLYLFLPHHLLSFSLSLSIPLSPSISPLSLIPSLSSSKFLSLLLPPATSFPSTVPSIYPLQCFYPLFIPTPSLSPPVSSIILPNTASSHFSISLFLLLLPSLLCAIE